MGRSSFKSAAKRRPKLEIGSGAQGNRELAKHPVYELPHQAIRMGGSYYCFSGGKKVRDCPGWCLLSVDVYGEIRYNIYLLIFHRRFLYNYANLYQLHFLYPDDLASGFDL